MNGSNRFDTNVKRGNIAVLRINNRQHSKTSQFMQAPPELIIRKWLQVVEEDGIFSVTVAAEKLFKNTDNPNDPSHYWGAISNNILQLYLSTAMLNQCEVGKNGINIQFFKDDCSYCAKMYNNLTPPNASTKVNATTVAEGEINITTDSIENLMNYVIEELNTLVVLRDNL